ncbi:MAG: GDSL-type esterase/lipase family protein [Bacteroidota bacterium]
MKYKNKNALKINGWILACLLSFACCVLLKAQTVLPVFVKPEHSKLVLSKDSSRFMDFYKKMDDLKKGKRDRVNIVHFGGSHIQAGFWPEVLMNGFYSTGNYEGGGLFIFPFKIVKTNNPSFYRSFGYGKFKRCRCAISREMCDNLGMAGMAAITNDSLSMFGFKILETSHPKNFNSVKVYHNFNPSFELSLNHESTLKYVRKDHEKKGYTEFTFETYIDSLNFVLIKKDTLHKDFILRGFSAENSKPGFYYASMGVNGAASGSFLRCPELVNELKSIPPDLVIFTLGVNDTHDVNFTKSAFIAKHDSLIAQIKRVSPNCAFLFVTTTDNYMTRKASNKRPIKAAEAAYELMEKHKGAVYDLYAVMGGYKSIYKWYKAGLAAKDKVHFNARGYRLFAKLMYDAIDRSYKNNSKVKE